MLTRLLVHIAALLFVFYVVWGIRGSVLWAVVVMALILAVVNTIIRPILLILTLPVTIVTLGLFVIVLNALLFGLSLVILQGILNLHFTLGFSQILLGYMIYVVISFVLTRIL